MAKHTPPAPGPPDERPPDERPLTRREAVYLARLASLETKQLEGLPIAKAHELVKWRIDPALLLFRRICGKVVKLNAATGAYEPVPNATVYVEDTDCSFLGFFPVENPFFWFFPLRCDREVLATVTTDACGEFCVFLPYWDVDRYLSFRRSRICFPDIRPPILRDLLPRPLPDPIVFWPPIPRPDPPPFRIDLGDVESVRSYAGAAAAERLERTATLAAFGEPTGELEAELDRPLFPDRVPPPVPAALRRGRRRDTKAAAAALGAPGLASAESLLQHVDFDRFVGPFWRCRDMLVPVWHTVLDVPDITFRVTQDVIGDGSEYTIYAEGFFDVRWNAPSHLHVTLVASGAAISTPHCRPVEGIACHDTPAISTAGYMPLEATHHDDALGVGVRVNRPRPPDGLYATPQASPAHAPYARTLNLHGCHRLLEATHYRLTYAFRAAPSALFTAPVPFTGLEWWAPRLGPGAPIHVVPDADGWYPIPPAGQMAHPNWLLSWPTHRFANGLYEIRLELGVAAGGSIAVTHTSDPRRFLVDNSSPTLRFDEIRWRPASIPLTTPWTDGNSSVLPAVCPVLTRASGTPVHLRIAWAASATHLRNAQLSAGGCGAGGLSFVTGETTHRHWHVDADDNAIDRSAVLELPGDRPAGCYHLRIDAWGRQFNPSGFDFGPALNWFVDQGTFGWSQVTRAISLVNA